MRKFVMLLAFVSMLFAFSNCKKGDTGATGPQGPQGVQGPQGSTGTANVIYSDWFSFGSSDWKDTTMLNITRAQRVIKAASALTQPILDSGVLLVYLRDASNNHYQLPFTYNVNPPRVLAFIPLVGRFVFYEYATDGSGGVASVTNRYRYILIPGGVKTNGRMISWKQMDYKDVCARLGIPE